MEKLLLRSTLLIYAAGKQQIKSFDKNKKIPIDGTNKIFI